MNKREFIAQRREVWKEFEALVDKFDRVRLRRRPPEEISQYSRLLRELSNDLAVIRSRDWGGSLVAYLNHLVARGHNAFYAAPPGNLAQVVRFLTTGFPRLFRANVGYFAVAAALFFVPGIISWTVIQNDPSLANRIIPDEMLDQFDSMYSDENDDSTNDDPGNESESDRAANGDGNLVTENEDSEDEEPIDDDPADEETEGSWDAGFGEGRAGMAGFYVYNNVGIALACFARGALLGIGTVYTLLYNGITIGAIGGYIVSQGNGERFVSFIISHGSFELTAIAVAGQAGLMLGDALIHLRQSTRIDSLRRRGLEAVKIGAGAAVMLFIAALIEAFWSPSGVPVMAKYIVGSMLWVLVALYLAMAGGREASV